MKSITPEEFVKAREEYILVDVREFEELEIAQISFDLHIPMQQFENHLDKISKEKKYVILCRSGGRSAMITNFLNSAGYDAYNLEGGILRYSKEIDPSIPCY